MALSFKASSLDLTQNKPVYYCVFTMKLYYFIDPSGNFGDDLNPWIWDRLLPDFFDKNSDILFIGIGTLLNHRVPFATKRVVFGSGVGYGEPIIKDQSWDIICVRGPWSARQLGIDISYGIIDPAIFINRLYNHGHIERCKISFMPAGISASRGLWQEVCQIAGIQYIDPRGGNVEDIMQQIDQTRLLLTEAMHGAIAAEAFRIPWICVHSGDHMNHNKWRDFCESLNLIHCPHWLPTTYRGVSESNIAKRLKLSIKNLLATAGSSLSKEITPSPIQKKSTGSELEQAANRLIELSSKVDPLLSSDDLFSIRLETLFHFLDKVKKKYSS